MSFSFNKIEVEYTPQGKDGLPQGGMTFADQWSADASRDRSLDVSPGVAP